MKAKQLKDLLYLMIRIARTIEEYGGSAEEKNVCQIAQLIFKDVEKEEVSKQAASSMIRKLVHAVLYTLIRIKIFETEQGSMEDEDLRAVVDLTVEHLALQYISGASE